ncbi:MAG: M48 family metalloprotease [Candidatus Omnitrophica bacterium]|nr:M48 family metalloprotease [Candidatus Omnitrophota bacterium]
MGNGPWRLIAVVWLAGCATTFPAISQTEYNQVTSELQVKALQFRFHQMVRVQTVGTRLVSALPPSVQAAPTPSVGLVLSPLDWAVARAFNLTVGARRQAVVVTGVIVGAPAERAGIQTGDLLVRINQRYVGSVEEAIAALRRLTPHTTAEFLVERAGAPLSLPVAVAAKPYPVTFHAVIDGEGADLWNAWASPGQITVTNRLLEFMHSDDELAVVMGHELAHLTQGHIAKGFGTSILGSVLATAIEQATHVSMLGDVAGGAASSAFSRNFEREADYIGLQYTHRAGYDITVGPRLWERVATELPRRVAIPWLSTHPSEPERLVRLQKAVEEITRQP